MKRMINTMNLVLAGIFGLVVIGVSGASAGTADYKNIIDLDRFVANLEDAATTNICSGTKKVYTAEKIAPEGDYRTITNLDTFIYKNIFNMDAFIAALKDPRDVEYRNVFTLESFVAALGGTTAPEYRNIIDLSRFVAALKDQKEVEYRNIIDLDRFVTALKDNKVGGAIEIACKEITNTYASASHEVKNGM